jgi:hypothetical protein
LRAAFRAALFIKIPTALAVALSVVLISLISMSSAYGKQVSESGEVVALRDLVSEWNTLRRAIIEEESDWKMELNYLNENLDLLNRQIASIEAKLEETAGVGVETGLEMDALDSQLAQFKSAEAILLERVEALELSVSKSAEKFPEPLAEMVEPLLRRIPELASGEAVESRSESRIPLGQRLQNVVGIISLAQKFNTSLTYRGELREMGGEQIQVWTLYWGLAASYSTDKQATSALIGYPTPDGWKYDERPELAADVAKLLSVYDGQEEPVFVPLPMSER